MKQVEEKRRIDSLKRLSGRGLVNYLYIYARRAAKTPDVQDAVDWAAQRLKILLEDCVITPSISQQEEQETCHHIYYSAAIREDLPESTGWVAECRICGYRPENPSANSRGG